MSTSPSSPISQIEALSVLRLTVARSFATSFERHLTSSFEKLSPHLPFYGRERDLLHTELLCLWQASQLHPPMTWGTLSIETVAKSVGDQLEALLLACSTEAGERSNPRASGAHLQGMVHVLSALLAHRSHALIQAANAIARVTCQLEGAALNKLRLNEVNLGMAIVGGCMTHNLSAPLIMSDDRLVLSLGQAVHHALSDFVFVHGSAIEQSTRSRILGH